MRLLLVLLAISLCYSCSKSVRMIGSVNMISHRNINPNGNHELKARYVGGGKSIKKSKAQTVEDAINNTVKTVPGGEFLANAKLYIVKGKYFAIEGDVWGTVEDSSFRGFSIGDRVVCKDRGFLKSLNFKTDLIYGKITGIEDEKEVYVKVEGEEDRTIKVSIDKLTKAD